MSTDDEFELSMLNENRVSIRSLAWQLLGGLMRGAGAWGMPNTGDAAKGVPKTGNEARGVCHSGDTREEMLRKIGELSELYLCEHFIPYVQQVKIPI